MSEEQDYVIITIGDDSEGDSSDDLVIIPDSETELTENTVSTDGMPTVQQHFQGSSDNYQPPSQMLHEVEGLAGLGNQQVAEMNRPANLKRCNPNSAEVEFIPLYKRAQLSIPRVDDEGNEYGFTYGENHHQLKDLQHYCEGLQDLINCTDKQVDQLCEVVTKIQHSWKKPSLPNTVSVAVCPTVAPEEPNLANIPEMNYATAMGNNSMGPDTALSSSVYTCPNLEDVPEIAEIMVGNNPETMNYPTSLGNDNGQCSSLSICLPPNSAENYLLVKIPGNEETSLENSSETVHYPASLVNINGPDTACSSSLPPSYGMLDRTQTSVENNSQIMPYPVLLIKNNNLGTPTSFVSILPNFEMLARRETNLENSTQMVNNPPSLENDNGDFIKPSKFLLMPVRILVRPENGMENSHGTETYPIILENNNNQNTSSSSAHIRFNYGFLGDPKRNICIHNYHLMAALTKGRPKYAACYLVCILFSNEVLVCSSAAVSPDLLISSDRQPLDPNKMAAIREYLATVFPNYDLSECGKHWKECISYINSLIRSLCSCYANKTREDTVVNNRVPTNPGTSASAGLKDGDGDGCESSFQLAQQAAASETGASGSSQQSSNAHPTVFVELSTDDSEIPLDELRCFGHPSRNVQLPYSVLSIAKAKPRPELSARYLIRTLFPDDVLVKSNVLGSLAYGIDALCPNRIAALREFLQDNYPYTDLSETGCGWKSCVKAINSRIRNLRHDLSKSTPTSQ